MTDAVPDGPMPPAEGIRSFLRAVPDGAVIETDPETAGPVEQAAREAGRTVTVVAYPTEREDRLGTLRASWDGPADGEHHEIEGWL